MCWDFNAIPHLMKTIYSGFETVVTIVCINFNFQMKSESINDKFMAIISMMVNFASSEFINVMPCEKYMNGS